MPTYTFRDKETGVVFDKLMPMRDHEEFLKNNTNLESVIGAPAIGDSVRLGVRTIDNGFREVLSKIHNNNYKSNLDGKLSRK